jgi:hypothetical protein
LLRQPAPPWFGVYPCPARETDFPAAVTKEGKVHDNNRAQTRHGTTTNGSARSCRRNSMSASLSHRSKKAKPSPLPRALNLVDKRRRVDAEGIHVNVTTIAVVTRAARRGHLLRLDTDGNVAGDDLARSGRPLSRLARLTARSPSAQATRLSRASRALIPETARHPISSPKRTCLGYRLDRMTIKSVP